MCTILVCLTKLCSGLHSSLPQPICPVVAQFGYAFKDEVALFEVAHRPNEDLPALRYRHHNALQSMHPVCIAPEE